MKKKIEFALSSIALMLTPAFAYAADPTKAPAATPVGGTGVTPVTPSPGLDIATVLSRVAGFLLGFSAIIAVIFLIYGGLRYVTSGGNKDSVEAAKNTILYSVIGLVVILLAYVIVEVVKSTAKIVN